MQLTILDLIRKKREERAKRGITKDWVPVSLADLYRTGWDKKSLLAMIDDLVRSGDLKIKKCMPCDLYKIIDAKEKEKKMIPVVTAFQKSTHPDKAFGYIFVKIEVFGTLRLIVNKTERGTYINFPTQFKDGKSRPWYTLEDQQLETRIKQVCYEYLKEHLIIT